MIVKIELEAKSTKIKFKHNNLHMINTGSELRLERQKRGISQAKFSEITGLPQHLLSSFELGKIRLGREEIDNINLRIFNSDQFEGVVARKKRYRNHTFTKMLQTLLALSSASRLVKMPDISPP